jgi:pimeloyl-ACP methyl ester carboxylesterase
MQVPSGDVTLAVREHSPAGQGRPTVVLVHGYPDQQDVWSPLVRRLPLDAWHVVTYDVRGAGGSTEPATTDGYRTDRLVDDLVAVLDAVAVMGERVHLVGHDWGSVQLWSALAAEQDDPRLHGRIASFLSVSGPSLDHAAWLTAHPQGRLAALAQQALRSWYIGFFNLPVLPTLAWRVGHGLLARAGHWGPELRRNAVNGLGLYRANMFRGDRRRLRTDVPVLVVQPEHDPFVSDVFLDGLDEACSDVTVERLDAGHWVVLTHADQLAALLVEHVSAHS